MRDEIGYCAAFDCSLCFQVICIWGRKHCVILDDCTPLPNAVTSVARNKPWCEYLFTPWKLANSANQGGLFSSQRAVCSAHCSPGHGVPSTAPRCGWPLTGLNPFRGCVASLHPQASKETTQMESQTFLLLCQSNKSHVPHPSSPPKCLCMKPSPFCCLLDLLSETV